MKPLYSNATQIAFRGKMHFVWEAVLLSKVSKPCIMLVYVKQFTSFTYDYTMILLSEIYQCI